VARRDLSRGRPLPARAVRRGRALALTGIVLLAFSLRSAVASLSPLVGRIGADFALSATAIGLIAAIPPACFAVFGILTPRLERRVELERATLFALILITAGLVARGLATGAPALLAATIVVFAGVGAGNVLLPPLVKKHFPHRIGPVTTVYLCAMAASTFLPPLVAVRVADAAGWRVSIGLWAVFSVAALLPWIRLTARTPRTPVGTAGATGAVGTVCPVRAVGGGTDIGWRLWRLPLAWALTTGFAVSAVLAYTSFAWMPQLLVDLSGVTPATAGAILSVFAVMSLPTSLVVPLVAARLGAAGIRAMFGMSVLLGLTALGGLAFLPEVAPWLWVALLGLATLLFPLTLVLLGVRTRFHETTTALSGFVQSVGYGIASVFAFGVGSLHAVTGGWSVPLVVLALLVLAVLPAGIVASRPETVEDAWQRRHGPWT